MNLRASLLGTAMVVCGAASMCGMAFGAAPASDACQARVNDTPARLMDCVRRNSLWDHLAVFQRIADAHLGVDGHGNRDTGTAGYRASVDYVAGLMLQAGYSVAIQPYQWRHSVIIGVPEFSIARQGTVRAQDWFVADQSGSGSLTALVQPAGGAPGGAGDGCTRRDFANFSPGNLALLQRGKCGYDVSVANATAAGAAGVIIYNTRADNTGPVKTARNDGGAFQAHLTQTASIPVVAVSSHAVGTALYREYSAGHSPVATLHIRVSAESDTDYNLIAESPYGDPNCTVVVDAHLDAIFGAGMLDNASGSTTILEIALEMARTPTRNRLRYIWFGGEELGLLGSHYYTRHLTADEIKRIAFDIDVDVTATPNYAVLVADPGHASNVKSFPPNVVPQSQIGNHYFYAAFGLAGIPSDPASFGNDGTDSNSFSLIGIPNTGILTQQDCCKPKWQVRVWGGYPGNYEGLIPSYNGGCVDMPNRWCDNLSNNDPDVLTFASKATAYVVHKLANDASLRHTNSGS